MGAAARLDDVGEWALIERVEEPHDCDNLGTQTAADHACE